MAPRLLPRCPIRALILTAALAACTASADPSPVRTQQIQSIAIDGGRGLPLAALRARITTHVGELVDAQRLEQDRVALEAELAGRGYLAARVGAPSVTFGARGGAYIVFDVERGPLFHLRAVTVTGPAQRDAGVVTLLSGDEASEDRIAQARRNVASTLERHGHRAPQVDAVLHTDIAAASLDVELVTH